MVPTPSRRALLQTTGVALAAGLAGCELKRVDENESDSGADDSSGGDGNTPTTVPPDASYHLQVSNEITPADLEPVEDLATDTAATVHVDVDKNYMDRDDETVFERTLELAPEESRTFEDVFSTEADGPEHVVAAELEPFRDEDDRGPGGRMSLTSAERFEPGGFGAPTSRTFTVRVMDGEEGDEFGPWVLVRNEEPESG